MKEKIKIMLSLVIFLFLFPYIVTVFFQGTPVAGESVYETATETAVMAQGSMPKEREQLIAILAKEIHVDSEREAIRAQAVIARANYDYAVAAGREPVLSMLKKLIQFGLDGIEAYYSLYSFAQHSMLMDASLEHGILVSGGSDYHGSNQSSVQLGTGGGALAVPDAVLEKLEQAWRARQ